MMIILLSWDSLEIKDFVNWIYSIVRQNTGQQILTKKYSGKELLLFLYLSPYTLSIILSVHPVKCTFAFGTQLHALYHMYRHVYPPQSG